MGRIREAATVAARAVYRFPVPAALYTHGLREARRPMPPSSVQKAHAIDREMLGRTRCVWLDRHRAERGLIVHLHSGAYVSGPFVGDWEWISALASARRCAALMIDYRVAPDHVHPVARDDVRAALDALAQQGRLSSPWILSGHNAGGGLAFTVARGMRLEDPENAPSGIIVMSPWLDLELGNTEITETTRRDPVHERRTLRAAAASYAGQTPLDDPELSPINADLGTLAPVHLSVGTKDLLLTENRIARLQLEEAGVDVRGRELTGRLGTLTRMRRGEDMKRLLAEQRDFITDILGPIDPDGL